MGLFAKLFDSKEEKPLPEYLDKDETGAIIIYSPLSGTAVSVKEMNDAVFTDDILGKGHAIEPKEGLLTAPVNGTITAMYKTNHAICLTTDDEVELLIHIGEDTVKLGGVNFTPLVKKGDRVRVGQPLMKFNIAAIHKAGYTVTTPIIIINPEEYKNIEFTSQKQVKHSDVFAKITKNS